MRERKLHQPHFLGHFSPQKAGRPTGSSGKAPNHHDSPWPHVRRRTALRGCVFFPDADCRVSFCVFPPTRHTFYHLFFIQKCRVRFLPDMNRWWILTVPILRFVIRKLCLTQLSARNCECVIFNVVISNFAEIYTFRFPQIILPTIGGWRQFKANKYISFKPRHPMSIVNKSYNLNKSPSTKKFPYPLFIFTSLFH